jgi:hypothetical protein
VTTNVQIQHIQRFTYDGKTKNKRYGPHRNAPQKTTKKKKQKNKKKKKKQNTFTPSHHSLRTKNARLCLGRHDTLLKHDDEKINMIKKNTK